ncbi:MAG: hemolysin family protein [Acidaminococcaceae bacterium]
MTDADNGALSLTITLCVLIIFSAFFSASETSLSSCNRIRLKNMKKDGDERAAKVLNLIENFDNALSTILIGNNIVNIAAASIATVVFTIYWGPSGLTYSTIVMTVVVLIFGEIFPKSFAKERPEAFAMWCAPFLRLLIFLFTPINNFLLFLKTQLRKMMDSTERVGMTEDELIVIIDEVESEGTINKEDSNLIKSAIEFSDIRVKEILTPRVDIVACDCSDTNEEICQTFDSHGFSRLPIYKDDIDHIVGVIHSKDFYNAYLHNPAFHLEEIVRDIAFVHNSTKISLVLKTLQQAKVQAAIVLDSYGGVRGLVSIEDIVEELVGEIWDEHDEAASVFHKIGNNRYLIACNSNQSNANLHDLFKFLKLDFDQYELDNTSISGWVVDMLGEIPNKGATFTYRNLHVTVNKTNIHRVLEIIIEIEAEDDSNIVTV